MKNLTAIQAHNVSEITVSYRNEIPFDERQKITSSRDAQKIFREFIGSDTIGLCESFVVAMLDRANGVLGVVTISTGGLAGCIADPKLIYSIALKAVAHGTGIIRPYRIIRN